MKIKVYDYLSEDAKTIREKVFINEQGFEHEFDDIDKIAAHIVMYGENDEPVATCRVFEAAEKGSYIFGRLAVIRAYRGMGIGRKMITEAEKLVVEKGGTSVSLHAQCRVKSFYEKSGYREFGDIEDDEGCSHIWMSKGLLLNDPAPI